MKKIVTPPAVTFDWSNGCRVTGNPVVTDPSPNVTPPAANRILTLDYRAARMFYKYGVSGGSLFPCCTEGGTSVAVDTWFFDATLNLWVKFLAFGGPSTISNFGTASIINPGLGFFIVPGMKWFFQIVTVTGAVTAFSYAFI